MKGHVRRHATVVVLCVVLSVAVLRSSRSSIRASHAVVPQPTDRRASSPHAQPPADRRSADADADAADADGRQAVAGTHSARSTAASKLDSRRRPTTIGVTNSSDSNLSQRAQRQHKATIVVQMSGEMANQLQHIAIGKGLQWWLQDDFNVTVNLVVRSQPDRKPKWKIARQAIQRCFPNLSAWNFHAGTTSEFLLRRRQQNQWNKDAIDRMQGLLDSWHVSDIRQGLQLFRDLTHHDINYPGNTPASPRPKVDYDAHIGIPFILSQSLDPFPIIDRYYSRLRTLFRYNHDEGPDDDATPASACCRLTARPDETVLHFRNYQSELGERKASYMGFPEITPNHTIQHVFPVSMRNDGRPKAVAITTRILNNKARAHTEALSRVNIPARIIEGQTGPQDFCFLKSAKAELVGNARSTYVLWAALLGNASTVRLYNIDSVGIRQRHGDRFIDRFSYNFTTNYDLRQRIRFELYPE